MKKSLWAARGACALGALVASFVSPSAKALSWGNVLPVNHALSSGQELDSANNQFRAVMQGDGNFVVYKGAAAVWATGTNGKSTVAGVFMQGDGNLCVNGPSAAVWCNFSNRGAGSYFLMLRNSGDLEVYSGASYDTAHATLIWTSRLDPGYYGNRYADLKAAFGSNAQSLLQHWITYGRFEGRSPNASVSDQGRKDALGVNLDTRFYADKYADLKAAFGYDAESLYQHWMNHGRAEGRVPNKATDDFLAGPPRSAHLQSSMRVGDWLREGQRMVSPSGQYRLDLQPDAQFVIYQGQNPSDSGRRWFQNSHGYPTGQPYFVIMQGDGHLCEYKGTGPADNRGLIGCSPAGAGGPQGRYFAAMQDDGNLAIYKGGGPADNRGSIWDRITTKPSSGFDWHALVEAVAVFVTSSSNTVAQTTVSVANDIGNETATAATKSVSEIVNTANLVANTSDKIAVTAGADIQADGTVIGNEVVKDGKVVGYALAQAATDAWSYLNTNCGKIGRTVFPLPLTQSFQGADQLTKLFMNSQIVDPNTRTFFTDANKANAAAATCFSEMQDGFYCAMPAELASFAVDAGQIPGNLLNLSTRIFNEAKTKDCLIAGAATVTVGALGIEMCAFGRVVVGDSEKAIACFSAAHSHGLVSKYAPSGGGGFSSFPSQQSCQAVGHAALIAAEQVTTGALSKEAKAATAAGKSNTAAQVADQIRDIYKFMNDTSKYQGLVNDLNTLPECH